MYQLKSLNRKGDIILLKNEVEVGGLKYKKGFSINADINLSENLIQIKSKTRWKRVISIYKKEEKIGGLIFNWKSQGLINLIDREKKEVSFILKRKKMGKKVSITINSIPVEIRSKFSWKTFNYNYSINLDLEIKYYSVEELFFYTVYMLNLYRKNSSSGV